MATAFNSLVWMKTISGSSCSSVHQSTRGRGGANVYVDSGHTPSQAFSIESSIVCVCISRGGLSDRRLLVLPLDHLVMLPVLQVIGQLLVVGLLCMLLRCFALKPQQQKGLFGTWRWARLILILQPNTRWRVRQLGISSLLVLTAPLSQDRQTDTNTGLHTNTHMESIH